MSKKPSPKDDMHAAAVELAQYRSERNRRSRCLAPPTGNREKSWHGALQTDSMAHHLLALLYNNSTSQRPQKTPREMREHFPEKKDQVYKELQRLLKKGMIERKERGTHKITSLGYKAFIDVRRRATIKAQHNLRRDKIEKRKEKPDFSLTPVFLTHGPYKYSLHSVKSQLLLFLYEAENIFRTRHLPTNNKLGANTQLMKRFIPYSGISINRAIRELSGQQDKALPNIRYVSPNKWRITQIGFSAVKKALESYQSRPG